MKSGPQLRETALYCLTSAKVVMLSNHQGRRPWARLAPLHSDFDRLLAAVRRQNSILLQGVEQVRCAFYNGTLGTGFGQRFHAANDALPRPDSPLTKRRRLMGSRTCWASQKLCGPTYCSAEHDSRFCQRAAPQLRGSPG